MLGRSRRENIQGVNLDTGCRARYERYQGENLDDRVDSRGEGHREDKNSELIPGFWFGDGVAGRAFHHKEE